MIRILSLLTALCVVPSMALAQTKYQMHDHDGQYTDGPSVKLDADGTYIVEGCVQISEASPIPSPTASFKLWDGITMMQSVITQAGTQDHSWKACLSGVIKSPVGPVRISGRSHAETPTAFFWVDPQPDGSAFKVTKVQP